MSPFTHHQLNIHRRILTSITTATTNVIIPTQHTSAHQLINHHASGIRLLSGSASHVRRAFDESTDDAFTITDSDRATVKRSHQPFTASSNLSASPLPPVPTVTDDSDLSIDSLDLTPALKQSLKQRFKISQLYPIQAESYTPIVDGSDMIGRSRTGTGKTLAFVLPIVERLLRGGGRAERGTCRVLIMEPTRELARQVAAEIEKLTNKVSVLTLYGGSPYQPQQSALRGGVDIVIATPGRLLDHIQRGNLSLSNVMTGVLDESDEMLRMGFVEPIEEIFALMPSTRQTVLFSATMPRWVQGIARKFLTNPLTIDKTTGNDNQASLTVTHRSIASPRDANAKASLVGALVKQYSTTRAIVFCRTKADVDQLSQSANLGVEARALHGDVAQSRREQTMSDFRAGKFRLLVATDVAARGVDIPSVELVIQSGMPDEAETYIHRSGRTGRAGKSGIAIIMHTPNERSEIGQFGRQIGASIKPLFLSTQGEMPAEEINKVVEQTEKHIKSHMRGAPRFEHIAKELLTKHDNTALAAILSSMYGAEYAPRSLLTSEEDRTTVAVRMSRPPVSRAAAIERIKQLLGSQVHAIGGSEIDGNTCYIDVDSETATKLMDAIERNEQADDISIPSTLPESLYTSRGPSYSTGMRSSGQHRSRGGYSGGGRGGYSGGRQNNDRFTGFDNRRGSSDSNSRNQYGNNARRGGHQPAGRSDNFARDRSARSTY